MTPEQQLEANVKSQKDAMNNDYKRRARFEALKVASFLDIKTPENTQQKITNELLLSEAQKIYDWLILPISDAS